MHKNKDISKGSKTLQDEAGRVNDSEALKKAKEMFEKAKVIKRDTSGRGI
jgi:import inner membrane translocase subunit TIM44